MDEAIKTGDVAILKSDETMTSPMEITVGNHYADNRYNCYWFGRDGELKTAILPLPTLKKIR